MGCEQGRAADRFARQGFLCSVFVMSNSPNPVNPVNAFMAPFSISHGPVQMFLGQHMMQIPELQRPYAWEAVNARELIADLLKLDPARLQNRPQPQHYFGSLVVVERAGRRDDVVDGQQRLTTVSVLIGQFIRAGRQLATKCAQKANDNKVNANVQQQFKNIETNALNLVQALRTLVLVQEGIDPATQQAIMAPRILVSPEIRQTFRDLIDGGDGSVAELVERKLPALNIREISKVLFEEFVTGEQYESMFEAEQLQHLLSRSQQVTQGLVWVRLATSIANAAFELFESLNSKGKPLNVLGLLKVWLLSILSEVQAPQSLVDQVSSDFRSLSDDDDEIHVRFFEDFYRMRAMSEPVDGEKEAKKLSLDSRKRIFKDPILNGGNSPAQPLDQLINDEVSLMKKFYPTWHSLSFGSTSVGQNPSLQRLPAICSNTPNPDWVNNRLHLLIDENYLKHQIVFPFLTVASDCLGSGGRFADFEDLVHTIEKFFFRAKSVCDVAPKKIKDVYFKHLGIMKNLGTTNLPQLKLDLGAVLAAEADDKKFSARLVERCIYGTTAEKNRTKYFFSMMQLYAYAKPNQLAPQKLPGLLDLSQWQLEHIVPQNPPTGAHSLAEPEVHQIGNLCLLPPDWNQKLSNHDYQMKRGIVASEVAGGHPLAVKDSEHVFTDPQFASTQWTLVEHSSRIAQLTSRALQIFVV